MTNLAVEEVIGRAATDGEFRKLLFLNPEEALSAFELTVDEAEALKKMDKEKLDVFAMSLDEKIVKTYLPITDYP